MRLVGPNGDKLAPKLRVAICVPTRGRVCWGFSYDLAQMMCYTGIALVSNDLLDIALLFSDGTYIASNREDLVRKALEGDPTHLLWLDDDMRFPQDLLVRLLKHNKPVVGVNYATRKTPCIPITIKRVSNAKDQPSDRLASTPDSSGLERVEGIGFGAVLIRANVFQQVKEPWFENYWNAEMCRWVGEDIDFSRKCTAQGIELLIDHDLSKGIAHVGEFDYTLEHARVYEETYGGNNGEASEKPVHAGAEGAETKPLQQGIGGSGDGTRVRLQLDQ